MTARGDDRKLMNYLARHGYRVSRSAKSHWKIFAGEKCILTTSGTPSDWRSRRNFIHQLRRQTA